MVQAPLVLAHFTELMVAVGALHMVAPLIPDVVGSAVGALPTLLIFYFSPSILMGFGFRQATWRVWLISRQI